MAASSSARTSDRLERRILVCAVALLIAACSTTRPVDAGPRGATVDVEPTEAMPSPSTAATMPTTTNTTSTSAVEAASEYAIGIALEGSTGRVTALPPIGALLTQGEPIAEVDGSPIAIIMLGEASITRVLGSGVSDGADVRQLEQNLTELGYATAADLVVDDNWSDATTAAVIDWQHSLGVDETGVVGFGDVVFVGAEPTVIDHLAVVGDLAAGAIVVVATTEERVTFEITAAAGDAAPP